VGGTPGRAAPAGIGRDVSHGCIRLPNHAIERLAHMLPLGTPVRIA
jgi:lipoprotein-anchoring transpeptidase ErfK/SrfK